jgi:sigma-B regulation protein RsbU (phosphoserine phosphatase)
MIHQTIMNEDENVANHRVLDSIAQAIGVRKIAFAMNGQQALAVIARSKPDLVLLDVMMPEMDGYEMCRRLRRQYGHDELPVLFVTALDDPTERAACFKAGGTDMVSKPINAAEITARLSVHLENRILLAGLKAYRTRVREELDMARATQAELTPDSNGLAELRRRTGIDVQGVMETCSELGGHFWTVFETHRDTVGVLVADFTGHGVAAAFNAVRLHALMARRPSALTGPGELLEFLNHELRGLLPMGQFAAALACEIAPADGTLIVAGALVPPPIILERGKARYLPVSGPPLGAFIDATYDEAGMVLPPGGTLLLYSDGLVEAMVDGKAVVDEETLPAWVEQAGEGETLARTLVERFHHHLPGQPPDDLTLITIRRMG